jgi:hypothetical protein
MSFLTRFAMFWYDFIVGDDWTVAVGVIVALALTAFFAHSNVVAWFWMPLAVFLLLGSYAWRVSRR